MYKDILDKIKEYDCIAIFRHQRPDGDAMFSSLALYNFIKDNFKDKKVKVGGFDTYDVISRNDKISDKFISESLAIILDTSQSNRIDDERAMNAKFKIKIDHHPIVDSYGDINYADTSRAAAAELLADILLSKTFSSYKLSRKVCEYLYSGMMTDTINFRTPSTTYKTMQIAAKLIEIGDLKVAEIFERLMNDDYETYQKVTKIREHLKVDKQFGYIVLDRKQLDKIGLDHLEAKNHIDEIGTIKDLNVWAFLTENPEHSYDCSIRSKRKFIINTICQKYGGGGHANASGIKNLDKKLIKDLFTDLIEVSTK